MGWDNTMPPSFADGAVVDAADLNPIVANISFGAHFSSVFLGGQMRVTDLTGITGTEISAMQTPSVTFESGYLYQVHGMFKWGTNAATTTVPELRLHEGSGIAGAVPQSFAPSFSSGNSFGIGTYFSLYIKVVSNVTRAYTMGTRVLTGAGTMTCFTSSWIAILRTGDNTLMTTV
jgi:hypothetical protein